ncbi:phosphotyrosine protein phosphatase [Methylobacterium sp. J-059]|uniref:low molecular weight protein tyrosine phosphatase family protein n=1 Tax=Methylobacterium sp. J-059 TaxID=2836643 RepID=UPI001FBA9194|nr:phosphotyrosine protein phosphatase [Methylobacterium sp. J-059]MCJ2039630.1 phosphotyrosine protein phosphatase [Methylobacterium sp. J-059]
MRRTIQRVLFVCGRARLRSPTAEQVFSGYPGLEVACAGVSADADEPVTAEHVAWADLIVVMERGHRSKIQRRFRVALWDARLVCLDIPDRYGFMDPDLVRLLEAKVPPLLARGRPQALP